MVELSQHPNIKLLTYAEVQGVRGFVGNFEVDIKLRAKMVDHSKCTGCGTCWQKCPEKAPSEFDMGLGTRTAIYIPFPQAVPPKPVIDWERCRYIRYREWEASGGEGKKPPQCRICERLCPVGAIDWADEDRLVTERVGAIIVATGYQPFDPSVYSEYVYGSYRDIITGLELERMLSASGPTGGRVLRPGIVKFSPPLGGKGADLRREGS